MAIVTIVTIVSGGIPWGIGEDDHRETGDTPTPSKLLTIVKI